MNLRPYQSAGVEKIMASLAAGRKPIFVLPTGGGKTACGVELIKRYQGRRIFLAHRKELIVQAARHLVNAGLSVGIIKSGFPSYANRPVQVASIQTLGRRGLPDADLIVGDECHHFCEAAKTFKQITDHYRGIPTVGLTATPFRSDGQGLGGEGGAFDEIIVGAYADELVKQGYIVEPVVYAPSPASLIGVAKSNGDYVNKQLAKAIDKPKLVGDVVESWKRWAGGRTSLYFAVNVEHSKHIAAEFQKQGIKFYHVDADTDENERDDRVKQLAEQRIDGLVNVSLFGEGTDAPAVKCVGLVRPTESYGLFLQMVGRAVRPCADGSTAVAIDHAGCFLRFGRIVRRTEYSLDSETKISKPSDLRQCPKCFRITSYGRAKCLDCGLIFATLITPQTLPAHADGTLQMYTPEQIDAASAPAEAVEAILEKERNTERERLWFRLLNHAKSRRIKPAWVSAEYFRRTGIRRMVPIERVQLPADEGLSLFERAMA